MDVGGLLSALNQSIETATISQVAADAATKAQPGPAGTTGAAGAGAGGLTPGAFSTALTIPGTPTTGPGTSEA